MNNVKILESGILATIQDGGRIGHQGEGVINSGVMDSLAYQIGNALVGNNLSHNPASIEFGVNGGKVKFLTSSVVAITGARVDLKRNDVLVSQDVPIYVEKNDVLDFTHVIQGRFVYFNIAGGIKVPKIMDSHATSITINLGGFNGRRLKNGDLLPILSLSETGITNMQKISPKIPNNATSFSVKSKIRIVNGPEFDWFSEIAWQKLLNEPFTLGKHLNRMGYRIDGPIIEYKLENLLSEANINGAIQVSRDGQPIILMADRATHGGYPVIAKVIAADLGVLAQWPQNKPIYFETVQLKQAWYFLQKQANIVSSICSDQPWQVVMPQRMMANKIEQLFLKK
ncbi:biotin-dependent carboxyltransferase family protein [Leuconostoc sp. MS02]|uniref:Biotin-dependent carboxyltransferase family protein n=1 Tax=Leuconostoc aquikimchii TaxID=3236804 RepID=A0ABV3S6E3_9LACO